MKKSLFTLLVLMLFGSAYAQTYTSYYETLWNHGLHANNATFMGQVYIDDMPNDNLALELGAYDVQDPTDVHVVGGVLGVMQSGGVQYDHPVYFLTVNGEAGDRIIFKLYDHEAGQELDLVCEEEYEFEVDGGDVTGTYIWHFYTAKEMEFVGAEDNQWGNAANWMADNELVGRLPKAFENVTISSSCFVGVPAAAATVIVTSGNSLEVGESLTADNIIIKDGAQFFAPSGSQFSGTIEKDIQGFGNGEINNYYFLSMPIADFDIETGFEAAGMLNGDYDLYFFTQNPDMAGPIDPEDEETWWFGEWQNYKFYMNPDMGMEGFTDAYQLNKAYLYANSVNTTLSFTGTFYSDNGQFTCLNAAASDWPGYQLVGNPFPCNTTITAGNKIGGYYMINEDGRADVIAVENPIVAPATALLIQSAGGNPATGRRVTFVPSQEGEATVRSIGNPYLTIEVMDNGILEDRAYVRMYESENLNKFSLNNNTAKIYIPQNGKKFAAAYAGEAKAMPLCFTSAEGGIHTISVKAENMNCSYLHLIDNVTGADIDLLRTPEYSFDASASNYATRFRLVFDENATNEIVENFAFINNGELMINNQGEATLQVMDITGRILSTENIQNCYSKSLNLSAGVYVVRLSNGNDVKAQKIVVE